MGVRITSEDDRVAIFDSVSGFAFGPTFDDEDQARAFLDYVAEKTTLDPRLMTDRRLEHLLGEWRATVDGAARG